MLAKLEGVGIGFGSNELVFPVDMTIRGGELFRVTGPNGVGKTCLLKTVAGQLPSLRGRIVRKGGVAYWSHEVGLFDGFTPRRLLRLLSGGGASKAIGTCLKWLSKRGLGDVPMGGLSGGERGIAGLLTLAVNTARVFALDEPFIGLDEEAAETAAAVILSLLDEGRGGVIVDHYDIGLPYQGTYVLKVDAGRDRLFSRED